VKIPLFIVVGIVVAVSFLAYFRSESRSGHDLALDSVMLCAAAAVGAIEHGTRKP
jgi:hypothetical protein